MLTMKKKKSFGKNIWKDKMDKELKHKLIPYNEIHELEKLNIGRNEAYANMLNEVICIQDMFEYINELVEEQQEPINTIKNNVMQTKKNIEETEVELQKADISQLKYMMRSLRFKSSTICGLGVGLSVGIVKSSILLGLCSGLGAGAIPLVLLSGKFLKL